MIVGESLDVVLERIDPGCRDDPRLAHRTAEEVLERPRCRHRLRRPGKQSAEGTAEPLRETERDRVEMRTDLRGRHS
jgi:hypothetical protein